MERTVQSVAEQIISIESLGARTERCQEMATEKSAEQLMTHIKTLRKQMATKEFDTIRSKIFSFHSIRSVIIAELKTKVIKNQEYANTE